MGRSPDKNIKKINLKHTLDLDRKGLLNRQYNLPPLKDTLAVPNNGYVVLRLKADNPGTKRFNESFSNKYRLAFRTSKLKAFHFSTAFTYHQMNTARTCVRDH